MCRSGWDSGLQYSLPLKRWSLSLLRVFWSLAHITLRGILAVANPAEPRWKRKLLPPEWLRLTLNKEPSGAAKRLRRSVRCAPANARFQLNEAAGFSP